MSKRNWQLLIQDIIESGNKILLYTSNMSFEEFVNDSKTTDAVIRILKSLVRRPTDYQRILKTLIPKLIGIEYAVSEIE